MNVRISRFLSLVLVLCAAVAGYADDDVGTTGAAFLELGIGAEAGAMGEANTAWADNVYGMYFNPAGIAGVDRQSVGFTHNTLFLDLDYNYLAYVLPLRGNGTLAASVLYVDLGAVDRRTVGAGGDPSASLGSASGNDLAVSLTYARSLTSFLDLGATAKVINESLAEHSSTAFAVDLGLKWRPPVQGFTIGASLSNLGTSLRFVQQDDELPVTLRMGAGYRSPAGRWGLTGDVVWSKDQDVEGKVGGEYWVLKDRLALRAGANSANGPGRGLTVGAAFQWENLALDYAFIPFGDLGDQNLISLSYDFGPQRQRDFKPRMEPVAATRSARELEAKPVQPSRTLVRAGAFARPFVYQGGPEEFGWLGDAIDDVMIAQWHKDGFAALTEENALYVVRGDYWVVGEFVILAARLSQNGKNLREFSVSGPAATPFVPWNELIGQINAELLARGASVSMPAQARTAPVSPIVSVPARPPASQPSSPLPAPSVAPTPAPTVVRPEHAILIAPLLEYPTMSQTERARRLEGAIESEMAKSGWPEAAAAAYRFDATVSYLDGGDVIVYGRVRDVATGIGLGTVEAQGTGRDESALAARVADRIRAYLPR